MATRLTRADIMEVPLPSDYMENQCLPLVVMQPTADATNYMLKSEYATNGQPGVVDHAAIADTVESLDWGSLTNVPTAFPPAKHANTHLDNGSDPLPPATTSRTGSCPKGSGPPTDYLGGDIVFHNLPATVFLASEGDATISPGMSAGTTIFTGVVPYPAPGVYVVNSGFLYKANQAYPPAGMVHFDVYDPALPGWVQATASTDISVLQSGLTSFLRPILMSAVMTRVFAAAANGMTWRLVLDQSAGISAFFRVGFTFFLTALQSLN